MSIKCECGAKVHYTIREGSNPGCKEKEEINCPKCNVLLHSGIYNDATVYVKLINDNDSEELKV